MPADVARARVAAAVGEAVLRGAEAEWRDAARRADVWEADVVPSPQPVRDRPDGTALAMVAGGGFVVHANVLSSRPGGDAERAAAVSEAVRAAAKQLGVLPKRLRVRDPELEEALAEVLADLELEVEAAPLQEVDDFLDEAFGTLEGGPAGAALTLALTWREVGASAEEVAAFHAAAAAFHRAAPWESEGPADELLSLRFPDGTVRTAAVMGSGGMGFGVMLYSKPADALATIRGTVTLAEMEGHAIAMSFDARGEVTRTMMREVAAAGWELVGPDLYPRVYGVHLYDRRVTPWHLQIATVALRAIACRARGEDPEAETGVAIETLIDPWDDDDGDDDPGPWDHPEELLPIGPEGENADPEAALRGLVEPDRVGEEEEARFARLEGWLAGEEIPPAELEVDLLNARLWADFLQHNSVPASAVTECDLRLFVYSFHQTHHSRAERTVPALSRSLRLVVRFLEEQDRHRSSIHCGRRTAPG
jgi:hypothetical protein